MIEARIFTDNHNLDIVRETLTRENAELQGKYTIHDTIYRNEDKKISLRDEFLRLRVLPENIWDSKEVVLALKQTNLHAIGKESRVPIKLEFDTRAEAETYYEQNLREKYIKDFDFWRVGWQYFLPNGDVVDLEIIEDHYPSIEFKSKTDEGMRQLLTKFGITQYEVIIGPSVVAVKERLHS